MVVYSDKLGFMSTVTSFFMTCITYQGDSKEMCYSTVIFSAKSSYVIKVNGHPSEEYWMSMMRAWLTSIQRHLDAALKKGDVNPVTGEVRTGAKLGDEAKIARRLVCSYGNNYNCTGRVCFNVFSNYISFYHYLVSCGQ